MRFLSAQWVGILQNETWRKHAAHANACAARLEAAASAIEGVEFLAPRQANAVFIKMPVPALEALREKGWKFYTFIGAGGARFMASWDTTFEDVDALVRDIQASVTEAN